MLPQKKIHVYIAEQEQEREQDKEKGKGKREKGGNEVEEACVPCSTHC